MLLVSYCSSDGHYRVVFAAKCGQRRQRAEGQDRARQGKIEWLRNRFAIHTTNKTTRVYSGLQLPNPHALRLTLAAARTPPPRHRPPT